MNAVTQPWLLWALASAVFAALTAVFAKVGVSGVAPDFRHADPHPDLAAFGGGFCDAFTGSIQPLGSVPSRTWAFLALSGLATGLSWLCYFRALSLGDAARVAPVDKLSVVFVAIFATLFLSEHLSLRNWLGIALIFTGVVLVALKD